MNILVANDDGFDAEGIKLLVSKLVKYGNVVVVAPDRPRSASSHRILFEDMTLTEVSFPYGVTAYKTSGTPADCVRLATSVLGDFDLCFSGINNGLNLGTDIIYSGTVAVAREAYIQGIPSVAISVDTNDFGKCEPDLDNLLDYIFTNKLFSKDYVLNINYPVKESKLIGYKFAKMGIKRFKTNFVLENGICKEVGSKITFDINPDTDVYNASLGYATFVPIVIDMTNNDALSKLKK